MYITVGNLATEGANSPDTYSGAGHAGPFTRIRVDRSTPLGNPYLMGKEGRDEARRHDTCAAHEASMGLITSCARAVRHGRRGQLEIFARERAASDDLPLNCSLVTEDNRLQAAARFWRLRDRLLAGENIRLMCWCAPKRCHAHTIAHALAHVSAGAVFLRGEVADGDVDQGDDQPLAERPNSPAALLKVVGCTLLRGFATSRMLEIITETCQMEYCMGWNPNPLVGTQDDWMREQMMLSAKHGLAFEGLLALGESALNALGISAPRPKHASLIVTRLGAGPQRWHTDADCADTYSIMVAISSRRVRFEGGIEADLSPGDVLVFDARKRHAGTELVDEHRAIDMPNVGAVALAAHIKRTRRSWASAAARAQLLRDRRAGGGAADAHALHRRPAGRGARGLYGAHPGRVVRRAGVGRARAAAGGRDVAAGHAEHGDGAQ